MKTLGKSNDVSRRDRKEAARHQEAREHGHALRYTLKTGAKRLVKPSTNERKKAERSAPSRPRRHDVMDDPGNQMTG
jgi:hypothetical protein